MTTSDFTEEKKNAAASDSSGAEQKRQKKLRRTHLIHYAKKEKRLLTHSFFLTMAAVLSDLLAPYLVAVVFDRELKEGLGLRSLYSFALVLCAYFIVIIFSGISRYYADLRSQNAATRISAHVRDDVFKHVQHMPITYFDKLPAGKVVSRVTSDTKTLQTLYNIIISELTMAGAYIVFVYLSLVSLHWQFALVLLIPIAFLLLIIIDFRKKSARYSGAYRKTLGELNANVNENISNMELVRALGAEKSVFKRFKNLVDRQYRNSQDLTVLFSYSAYNAVGSLRYLTIVVILIVVGYSSVKGQLFLTPGLIYLFIDYTTKIFTKSLDVSMQLGQLERAYAAADHVFELLNLPAESDAEVKEEPPEPALEDAAPLIEFSQLHFHYNEDTPVLKGIDFSVRAGETVAIVGNTGSGKTTIMNLLLRFYDPQLGSVRLKGRDIREMKRGELRRHIAIVQQDCFLFTGNIMNNITLGKAELGADSALHALREVGGQLILDRHPEGLLTEVTQNGNSFSSGEKQLLCFARALAQNSEILILDEATSHVDSETEAIIQRGTLRLLEGRTTLIIAHRLSTIRHADQILVLEKGEIVERGTHSELYARGGVYTRMIEHQLLGSTGM